MNSATVAMAVIAVILLVVAYVTGTDLPLAGLKAGGRTLWNNLPLLLLGFAVAGLAQVLIPSELVSRWLGREAGLRGIMLGCVVGGLVPGSPYSTFPIVAGLYQSGAGIGAVVSFITAWALWSVSRFPTEMALISPRVALVRYLSTLVFPPMAGLIAHFVVGRLA